MLSTPIYAIIVEKYRQGGLTTLDFITINEQSSIRVDEGKIIYSDPYNIRNAAHDADIILITHSHFDHYSPDDIRKVMKSDTVIVCPDTVNEPKYAIPIHYGTVVGSPADGEKFRKAVDSGIEVVIKI